LPRLRAPAPPDAVEQALARSDVQALQALSANPDKLTRKAAKRALHLMKARGMPIPEPASAAQEHSAATPDSGGFAAETPEPILVTTIDGNGDRAVFLPLKARRGFVLHLAVLAEDRGIVSLTSDELSRKQLRAFVADLPSATREITREIPPARAAALLGEAASLSPDSEGAVRARELLRSLPPAAPPDLGTGPDSGPDLAASGELPLRESAQLFETTTFSSYLPPRETVLRTGQQLEEVMLSPLLVDETQRLAQLHHALERAEADYFTRERRDRFGVRLLDAAEFFAGRSEVASAARARAAAAALRSEQPIHEIPFARAFFERIFDLQAALKSKHPQPRPEPTSGGLILP